MGIREEIKQSKPFASRKQEIVLSINRTDEVMQQRLIEALKPFELSPSQYNMLLILQGAGPEGHSCKEAACRMVKKDPDITRLFDRMEKRGLIHRTRDSADRRVVHATITRQGTALLAETEPHLRSELQSLLKHIREDEYSLFIDLLERARRMD